VPARATDTPGAKTAPMGSTERRTRTSGPARCPARGPVIKGRFLRHLTTYCGTRCHSLASKIVRLLSGSLLGVGRLNKPLTLWGEHTASLGLPCPCMRALAWRAMLPDEVSHRRVRCAPRLDRCGHAHPVRLSGNASAGCGNCGSVPVQRAIA